MAPTYFPNMASYNTNYVPYGTTPFAIRHGYGWLLMQLGSIGGDKSSFYVRIWEWVYPNWLVNQLPLTEVFIHCSFAPDPESGQLFVFGLSQHGNCFEQIPQYKALVLGEQPQVEMIAKKETAISKQFLRERDRLWRLHKYNLRSV